MTDATDRRPFVWEGSSKKDFKEFPTEVQKDLGVALFVVQIGGTPSCAKPWKGLGSGVKIWNQHSMRGHRAGQKQVEGCVGTI